MISRNILSERKWISRFSILYESNPTLWFQNFFKNIINVLQWSLSCILWFSPSFLCSLLSLLVRHFMEKLQSSQYFQSRIFSSTGVVNCVSSWHSTRMNRVEFYLAQRLDRKFCLWTLCLILATATNLILDMSLKINALTDQTEVLKLIVHCLTLFQYVILILIPFITTCILGKRCCCWCCCKPCQPPLDD